MANVIQNDDEDYFVWWANELIIKGLARECEFEPQTLLVSDMSFFNVEKFLKRSTQIITKTLFNSLEWTPDFSLIVHRSLEGKMFVIIDEETQSVLIPNHFDKELKDIYQQTCLITTSSQIIDEDWVKIWFDVKPPSFAAQFSGKLGSSRDFKYLQRMLYEKENIYVNKVVMKYGKDSKEKSGSIGKVNTLFAKTFLPERYKFNNKDGKLRKLKNHERVALSIEQYLSLKKVGQENKQQQQELF